MAGSVNIRLHPLVIVDKQILPRLERLINYMEKSAPQKLALNAAKEMERYAKEDLFRGHGRLTGTLKYSIEFVPGTSEDGRYEARVVTQETRGAQHEAQRAMRDAAHARVGPRRGVHLRGRKFEGLPYLSTAASENEGYAEYVEEGRPNRRPVPFMSTALILGKVIVRDESAVEVREKIRAMVSI